MTAVEAGGGGSGGSVNLTQVGGSNITLGTATAAVSLPVALPTATITTLTPPSNTGYALSANQTNATQKTQIVDGSGNVIGSTSNSLNVAITSGAGSGGTAIADGGTFTEGTTSFTPVGGEYVSGGGANCTTAKGCTAQMTIDRMVYENVGKINGVVPLMGNGVTGTGSQRVTIASDNTPFQIDVLGNAGAVMDFAGQNASAPANALQMGCQFQTTPTTITAGNASPCQLDNAGNLLVNVQSATGLAQGSTTSGQTGSLVMGAASTNAPTATTGDTWPLSISPASGGVRIDLKDTAANTNPFLVGGAGTAGSASGGILTVQGVASMTPILANPGTIATWGLAANGGTLATNGLQISGQAVSAEPAATTNTKQVTASFDLVGKQITSPFANKENYVKGTTAAMTGTTSTQVIALAPSQKLYITSIHCNNSSASVPTLVSIQDGSGGTVLDTLAANDNFGGEDRTGSSPLFWTTAGNGLYAADVTTGASVICQASGYSGK